MGIAVLLSGGEEDRYAVLHAIALAKRIGEAIHGIRQESPALQGTPDRSPLSDSGQTLLLHLANSAGVTAHCHVLEGDDLNDLAALLREQRVSCLIVGASDEAEGKRAEKRLQALRRSIVNDRRWSMGSFWVMVTGPWSEEAMAAALEDIPDGCREVADKRGVPRNRS